MKSEVKLGDCLQLLPTVDDQCVDLAYLDPPFFTQKEQKLRTRDRTAEFRFPDSWSSVDSYAEFLHSRLLELHRVLRSSGSLFFHCDRNACHIARFLLDEIFGKHKFRSEIIWRYRRWSNSQRNLLPSHQNILFYTKSDDYKFNEILEEYSPSTNIDQILQKRRRDEYGKSVYATDEDGNIISNCHKKGVPISDVWDIPYLNPKAKERTGYPTQKPVLLLERIISLTTDPGDLVLDPFCGSGTTLVAAALIGRNSIGIDISHDAVKVTKQRLESPTKSESPLLKSGRKSYQSASEFALAILRGLDIVPVQRNKGIDALLKTEYNGGPVPIRVQRPGEPLIDAAYALFNAAKSKNASLMLVVSTDNELGIDLSSSLPQEVIVVDATCKAIRNIVQDVTTRA